MYAATPAEPTNDTADTSGWLSSASTESFAPWITLNTPSGSPASVNNSAIRMAESGVRCEGLCTKVFPHTMARGIIHSGTMFGKLNGVMPATTPTGNRTSSSSMPSAIWSRFVPIIRVGAPQASSTTSMARRTSPRDSARVLPFSWVTSRDSSSNRSSSRPLNRNITWARSGRVGPGGKGLGGGPHGPVDLLGRGIREQRDGLAGRRVIDRVDLVRPRLLKPPADQCRHSLGAHAHQLLRWIRRGFRRPSGYEG